MIKRGNGCPRTGTQFTAFLSNLKVAPRQSVLPQPWHEPCLTEELAANPMRAFAAHDNKSSIYEEVSVRLNCICGSLYAAQPERSSAVGLLTSGLLVFWSSHVRCSRVLICFHAMGFDRCFRVANANSTNKGHPDSSGSQSKTRPKT
jgi:hypothetical protein